jgi:hypothetical protein
MNNIKYWEQEMYKSVEENKIEKVRSVAPILYDYLHNNDFWFENTNSAYKPLNDDFEIGVTLWPETIDIKFFDRKKTEINDIGYLKRYTIYPIKQFTQREEDKAIAFLENPAIPQKYKAKFTYEKEFYFCDNLENAKEEIMEEIKEEIKEEISDWTPSGFFDISVSIA